MKNTLKFIAVCFCFTIVNSAIWTRTEPWVTPTWYVGDGNSYIDFTCTAYLIAGQMLLWARLQNGTSETIAGFWQVKKYYSGFATAKLHWPLAQSDRGVKMFCVKKNYTEFKDDGNEKWVFTQSEYIKLDIDNDNLPSERSQGIQITPKEYIEDGKTYIEFNCTARVTKWQYITWYQVKESNVTERLAVIQHWTFIDEFRRVTLVKTLEPSDNGTQIYCVTETLVEGTGYQKDEESGMIPIIFHRRIEPLERPLVTIQPNTDTVLFDDQEELEFVCGGGATVDGRGYTWHLQGTHLNSFAPPGQTFDKSTNISRLYLRMEVLYHGSQLYCAQDFSLRSSHMHGEVITMTYRELGRSRMVTLLNRKQRIPGYGQLACKLSKDKPFVTPDAFVDDGRPFTEFTCHAYLRPDEYLAWFNGTVDGEQLAYLKQFKYYYGYRTLHLVLPIAKVIKGSKIFCGRQRIPYSGNKILNKQIEESEKITIDFQRDDDVVPLLKNIEPQVTPKAFVDASQPYMEFTCWAYLKQWQQLTWFIVKGSNKERLAMIHQETDFGFIKIKLLRTLKASDNGSEIYCAQEETMIDGNFQSEKNSERIPISFDRQIEPLDPPYVTVTPRSDVMLFDDDEELELVCSGSEPVDGRSLTWYSEGPFLQQVLPVVQRYNKLTMENRVKLRMAGPYHGSRFYCIQGYTLRPSAVFGDLITAGYGEIARSRMITVLHIAQDEPGEIPRISPNKFEDENKPDIEFTCYSFLQKDQLLSWYHAKGSNTILLRTIQLQEPKYDGGQWVEVTLKKTLEQSDRGSEIYCARQSVQANGSFSDILESQRVTLTFKRNIPLLGPHYAIIEPSTSIVYFEMNTTLLFTCSGSIPVDGRTYMWVMTDSDSHQTVLEHQNYDTSTNLNVLYLSPNETYHESQLYCSQGFLSNIRHVDGSLRRSIYGELDKSDVITLILPEKAKPQVTPDKFKDKNQSFIQFNCRAFLQKGELLCWYQSKGSSQPEILLRMVQHQVSKHGQWVELVLKKTLEQSDSGSQVYCAKQGALPDGGFSDGLESRRVPITISRNISDLERPRVDTDPNKVVHFVSGTRLRFVCSGTYPVDDRTYTWFRIDSKSNVIVPDGQKYDASENQNVLELSLSDIYNSSQLYCAQGFLSYIRHENGSAQTKFYGELARSDAITLILLVRDGNPQIYPESFTDDSKSSIQFTCYAFLRVGDLLSWYQSQDKSHSNDTLLRISQFQDLETDEGQWMELALNKTVQQSDNGSEIYCAKQSALPVRSFSDGLESRRVPISIHRELPASEPPYVVVEPSTSVYFAVNTTRPPHAAFLRFVCRGSSPVDGRTYTWFRIDSKSNLDIPEDQKYDAAANENVLYLSPNETYDQSQLFCVQGFLSHIRYEDGSFHSKMYGEVAKSSVVTLIHQSVPQEKVTAERLTVLTMALPFALGVLIVMLCWLQWQTPARPIRDRRPA